MSRDDEEVTVGDTVTFRQPMKKIYIMKVVEEDPQTVIVFSEERQKNIKLPRNKIRKVTPVDIMESVCKKQE